MFIWQQGENSRQEIYLQKIQIEKRYKLQNDQTFSNKSIHEFTSLVFKRELEEKQKQNVVQIFQQVLEEDNEIDGAAKLTKLSHIKLNIRVPLYKAEFQEDYNKYDTQMNNIFYSAENLKRLIFRNGNGKIRVDKFEFIQRYRWVKDQRMKFIYSKIKYLFEHYCQEQVLEKVLKVDANLKFYKTLNKTSFYIIKINRLELYDETTNNNEKQDMQFINTNSFKPYTSALVQEVVLATQSEAYTLKNQSGYQYSDMEFVTNRDNNFKPLLIGHSLREDFLEQGSNTIYSLNEQHNPFIKEEINKISKRSHKLSLLFFLNRLLFFLEILLICFTYFFCSYYYNPLTLHNSVTLLGHVYKISLITVQSYNYIIDVGLMNENKLTSLLIVNPTTKFNTTEQFLQFVQTEIEEEYLFIYNIYTDYDFVSMVYSGFYIDDSDVSGLDIFDQYQLNLLQFNFSEKGTIDLNNTIILHFRDYMVPYGLQLMQDSIVSRINEAILYQTQSIDNLILFMIFLFSVLIINSIFSLVIKYQFRNDVNTIYNIVANIPKQDKIKAMMQHQTLFTQLNALFEEEQYGYKKPSMHALNADTIIQQDFEIIEVEKANQKRNKAKIIMLPKYQLNTIIALVFYLAIILVLFILVYYFIWMNQIQTKQIFLDNNFLVQTNYFWIITLLKEKFIYDNYLNSSFYPNITQFRFQEFLDDMAVTSPLLYQTTISDIQRIFDETLCDFYSYDESATYIYYEQFCPEILNGALKRGLKQFNILLSQVVIKALNPYDERYDDFKIDDLAQYQISFQIIYEIFQKSFEIWALDAENLLSQTSNLSLVSFIIQLLVIIVLYFSLLEYYLFTKLQNDFNFSKNYYRYFMLNQTMNQVKTMRVDMIRTGLLSK